MKTFKDNAGRTWHVAVTVLTVKRCKDLLGVSLPELLNDGLAPLRELTEDAAKLCDVLFVVCMDQAKAENVSDEQFGASMGGDAVYYGGIAMAEALVDFFHDPKRREVFRKIVKEGRRAVDLATEKADAMLEMVDVDLIVEKEAAKLRSEMRKLTDSAGDSPGSSESIPIPSRSAS